MKIRLTYTLELDGELLDIMKKAKKDGVIMDIRDHIWGLFVMGGEYAVYQGIDKFDYMKDKE